MEKYLTIEKTIEGLDLKGLRILNIKLIPTVTESYMEETSPFMDEAGNLTKITSKITKITTITLMPEQKTDTSDKEK